MLTTSLLSASLKPRHLDLALAYLYEQGLTTVRQTVQRSRVLLQAEISVPRKASSLLQILKQKIDHHSREFIFIHLSVEKIKRENWSQRYFESLQPFLFLKKPEVWIDPRPSKARKISSSTKERITFYLEPEMAFGTGTHPTTQKTAELLAKTIQQKKVNSLLDLGCGTGILALLAKRLGLEQVYAIDNDPIAVDVAQKNFKENHAESICLGISWKVLKGKKVDILVANILLSTLIELKPLLLKHLKKEGILILSGLLYRQVEDLLQAYPEFQLIERKNSKGWTALKLK